MEGELIFLEKSLDGRIKSFFGFGESKKLPSQPPEAQANTSSSFSDKFSFRELFQASGSNKDFLDKASSFTDGATNRFDGGVFLFSIEYDNRWPFFVGIGRIRYKIRVLKVADARFGLEYTLPIDENARLRRQANGVRIIFSQQGRLGRFR